MDFIAFILVLSLVKKSPQDYLIIQFASVYKHPDRKFLSDFLDQENGINFVIMSNIRLMRLYVIFCFPHFWMMIICYNNRAKKYLDKRLINAQNKKVSFIVVVVCCLQSLVQFIRIKDVTYIIKYRKCLKKHSHYIHSFPSLSTIFIAN